MDESESHVVTLEQADPVSAKQETDVPEQEQEIDIQFYLNTCGNAANNTRHFQPTGCGCGIAGNKAG